MADRNDAIITGIPSPVAGGRRAASPGAVSSPRGEELLREFAMLRDAVEHAAAQQPVNAASFRSAVRNLDVFREALHRLPARTYP